ncbi:ERF family protein [Citrobacter portucalensis]|uniref:ERF family protein n=1 Tax=Citrobacter portucalensis TaxID=1639133 RepID=UPI00242EE5DE|nr:ERF family protein [Citrobacter portucalensis]WFZ22202.1 ERF family protein [Citrobacter portucalensis]
MTTDNENTDPVINTVSNLEAKPEPAKPAAPAMHEVNSLGSQFADVLAALQWVSNEAQNPVKNRWSPEERFAWSDLPELYRMIKPLMYQAGLFHSQTMKTSSDGVPQIITTFRHIPTRTTHVEYLDTTSTDLAKQLNKAGRNLDEHQRWGWTMTYCRRYALYAALGLQPDDGGDLDAMTRRTPRLTGAQSSPATSTKREWLPMPSAEGAAAERTAVAMGAVPFTAEEHARAAEQERRFSPLTNEEIHFINRIVTPLKGDLRELDTIQRQLQEELFDKVRAGDVTFYDDEDQKRALYRVWLEACRDYDGMITARIITGDDDVADALIDKHFGHYAETTQEMPVYTKEDLNSLDNLATEDLERLKARREKLTQDVASGKMMVDCDDAAELDAIYYAHKSGEIPQPPFPEEIKLPAVNLTNEHAVLMRAKVTLCREIADGDGTTDEKVTLINKVLSRTDYQASAEINEILTRLTNPGAPASGIQEDDIPY